MSLKGSHYDEKHRKKPTQEASSQKSRNGRQPDLRGRAQWKCSGDLPSRGNQSQSILSLEGAVSRGRDPRAQTNEARSQISDRRSGKVGTSRRNRKAQVHRLRSSSRVTPTQKKRALGLHGSLTGRHLTLEQRKALLALIDEAISRGESLQAACTALEINRRAVYRWRGHVKSPPKGHGGGGGLNKIQPKEERAVIKIARENPQWRCRRLAYELERSGKAYIGKTKVAEIMLKNGLNHVFERQSKSVREPADSLAYEPRAKNLVWGMDWTWINVEDRYMFLLVILDWYSRKILAHGLFKVITKFEVVSVVTDAIAKEEIDLLPEGAMKPMVVADHGSANTASYTKSNIEIQGLSLWLSGVGRPTGNARTERVIGTLKAEEIKLQPMYQSEEEARQRINATIADYNHKRPNMGIGGHAPAIIHETGRAAANARRNHDRYVTALKRRNYWAENHPC